MSLIDDAYYEGLEQGRNNLAKYVNVIAAKDTEIAELKAQVEGLKTDMQHSRLIEAVQVKESNELKAEIKYWNERWEAGNKLQDAAFNSEIENYHEVKRLNAEIKRLRDGIAELRDWDYPNQMHIEKCNALLSPAPVTEGPKKTFSLQMYECNRCEWYGQVGESIETESYDVCPKCLSEDLTLLDSPKNEDQE